MTTLNESWGRTKSHLLRAKKHADGESPRTFDEYLDHNELELAADVLFDLGDEREDLPEPFWEALKYAYENMQLDDKAKLCRFRIYEAKYGFVEAQLTLKPTEAGGRSHPIFTDYRPDWDIGNRTDSGGPEFSGAAISLEDAQSISPGGSGRVRLRPTLRERWHNLKSGAEIAMHEGARVVGRAIVIRVMLRRVPSEII